MLPVAALASKLVPGHSGSSAVLFLLVAAVPAALAAAAIARRAHAPVERWAVTVVVFVLALVGLGQLPHQAAQRKSQYVADRKLSVAESEEQVQQSVGVDPGFLRFLAANMAKDEPFFVVLGPTITTSGFQSWAQFELLPELEEYITPCKARWLVFFDTPPPEPGGTYDDRVHLEPPVLTYAPGYSIERNATQCT
jgi:hypothetical protein